MTHIYPTASTTAIFINGYHVDQAYQVQFRESTPKIPIYGYNDYKYSKVVAGKGIVQGILILDFIFPGYLNSVLDSKYTANNSFVPSLYNYDFSIKGENQKINLEKSITEQLKSELPPNDSAETRSARANYIASLLTKDKNTKDATKKALEKFWISQSDGFKITTINSPIDVYSEGSILDIYYQDPAYETWFVRFLNVHFSENSQVISQAGAEGSSDNLFEVYNWIASEKKIKLIGEVE